MLVDLDVAGSPPRKVLLKSLQHHPVMGQVTHIDFYEVSMTRRLSVSVPLRLVGDPVGVTQQGGILDHLLRSIEVECLPADILEEIPVDVTELAVGKHLSVKDIKLDPAKYTILTGADVAIAAVSMPKAEEEVAAPAEGEASAEPEVLTGKKPEEGEGAEAGKEAPAKAGKEAGAKGAAPAKEAAPKAGKEKGEKK
jgi:large subunit ribosomal protein L25